MPSISGYHEANTTEKFSAVFFFPFSFRCRTVNTVVDTFLFPPRMCSFPRCVFIVPLFFPYTHRLHTEQQRASNDCAHKILNESEDFYQRAQFSIRLDFSVSDMRGKCIRRAYEDDVGRKLCKGENSSSTMGRSRLRMCWENLFSSPSENSDGNFLPFFLCFSLHTSRTH